MNFYVYTVLCLMGVGCSISYAMEAEKKQLPEIVTINSDDSQPIELVPCSLDDRIEESQAYALSVDGFYRDVSVVQYDELKGKDATGNIYTKKLVTVSYDAPDIDPDKEFQQIVSIDQLFKQKK